MRLNPAGDQSERAAMITARWYICSFIDVYLQYTGIYKGLYVQLEPQVLEQGLLTILSLHHRSGFKLKHLTSAEVSQK